MISARIAAFASLLTASQLAACASTNSSVSNLGSGVYELKCKNTALPTCLQQAERICHGKEYDVLRGQEQRKRFGGDNGTSVIEERASLAKIRCSAPGRPLLDFYEADADAEPPKPWRLQRRSGVDVEAPPLSPVVGGANAGTAEPGAPSTAAPTTAAPTTAAPSTATPTTALPNAAKPAEAPKLACVPGSTQTCVGPGACSGGQACLADGSGYAPCDCGSKRAAP